VLARPAVGAAARGLAPISRAALALVLGLLVFGQLYDRSNRTFPFVEWRLYEKSLPGDPQYLQYRALLRSGREIPLDPGRAFPSLGRRLVFWLEWTGAGMERAPDEAERGRARDRFETALRALGAEYNQRADDPIEVIQVWRHRIPRHPSRGAEPSERRPVLQVRVG
jgi:hypothetical protein